MEKQNKEEIVNEQVKVEKVEKGDRRKERPERKRRKKGSRISPTDDTISEKQPQRRYERMHEIRDEHNAIRNRAMSKHEDNSQMNGEDSSGKKTIATPQDRLRKGKRKSGNEPSPSTQPQEENPKYYEGETVKQRLTNYKWDFLGELEDEEVYNGQDCYRVEICTKIVFCILISTIVLATSVTSKLCLILTASNIFPPMNDTDLYWSHKTAGFSLTFKTHETNVQWIWALIMMISAPYLFTIMSNGWQLLLGREEWKSSWTGFLRIMIQETIHSIGLCMMAFILLPSIDPVAGILVCFNVATIPGFLVIYQRSSDKDSLHSIPLFIIAAILQLAAIVFTCVYYVLEAKTETRYLQIITICLSPSFISIHWWENYFPFGKGRDHKKSDIATETGGHEKENDTQDDVTNKQDDDKEKQDDGKNKQDDEKNKENDDMIEQDDYRNKQTNNANKYDDKTKYDKDDKNNQDDETNKQGGNENKEDDEANKHDDDNDKHGDSTNKHYNKNKNDEKNKHDDNTNNENDDNNEHHDDKNKPDDNQNKQDDNKDKSDEMNKQNDDTNKQGDDHNKVKFFIGLRDLFTFKRKRTVKCDILVNLAKLIITVSFAIILFGLPCNCTHTLFGLYGNSTSANTDGKSALSLATSLEQCHKYLPLIVAVVGIICSGACYHSVKIGCKIVAQIPCVSLPLTLSSPIALAALIGILSRDIESCALSFPLLGPKSHKLISHLSSSYYWMSIVSGICGYISLVIISCHIWRPDNKRLRKSKELFERHLYCGILLDQSILLNFQTKINSEEHEDGETQGSSKEDKTSSASGVQPKVYICATMWHETKSEMMKLLASIKRLDEDRKQSANGNDDKKTQNPEDIFDFEVHVFFDDAFETPQDQKRKERQDQNETGQDQKEDEQRQDNKGKEDVLNTYVKTFIEVMLNRTGTLPKYKYQTKYGGLLKWKLSKESVMCVHLKNKNLIRCKKRWSQVMYMYYFLANNVLDNIKKVKPDVKSIEDIQSFLSNDSGVKNIIENTFILTLDGDVDFQPDAVKYLLDRMRNKKEVGATCGRIHPTGSGPVVWYQKFEYAVSHWLQKTAENVLGCVLCSPGCFSLFRGSALMNKKVMKAYTTLPTKSWHHVQYDQGEDRWLCTLLLQQGYKVEYVAASDAYTEAPEGFKEFLNQRRRWSPSTMANILDLIINYKKVVKNNKNISRMYILYQAFLMFCTILTPGTILLMIIGAMTTAFPALSLWLAILITLLPVAVFIVICFNATTRTQLKFAVIFSTGYAVMMIIVLVGLAVHVVKNGLCSVTTIFFLYVAGVFVVSAILHPKEILCLLHGFVYFVAIPCTSIIMMLYALCNLNVTSWGTRETTQKQQSEGNIRNQWQWTDLSHGPSSLFKRMCCCQESHQQLILYKLDAVEKQLARWTKEKDGINDTAQYADIELEISSDEDDRLREVLDPDKATEGQSSQTMKSFSTKTEKENKPSNNSLIEVAWINDPFLLYTKLKKLMDNEDIFWEQMIRRYLYPLDQKNEDKKMKHDLTILRNKVCLFFILANALFICIIFALQQITSDNKSLSILLPCVTGENRPSYVEPISLAFTLVFGIMLLVQFVCMVLHRLGTLIHIYARTEIFKETKRMERQNDKIAIRRGKRLMRKLYPDRDRDERKKRKQHSNGSIIKPNVVHPTKEPGTNAIIYI
ncbi:hypothetical protein CHS0354_012497 [Potamilus streckersoni]|uniref:chitin synthase n=1 Tax=Potamilus streckersoni TaxID=2493646 RepID=A0AAE0SVW6_9BIVA|nr:hypothetical protein CHS0354_012497 [Potamilus streckersoni]